MNLEQEMIADTKRAINRFNQIDELVERSFYKDTAYDKLDREYPNKQFNKDKTFLRKMFFEDKELSLDVLNWSKTKVRNHAFALRGEK